MKTAQYLAALKARLGIESDYALAKALGVSRQLVSNYTNGQRTFGNAVAVRVAAILELDPMRVIADAELERGGDVQLWKRLRDAAAAVLVAIGAALAPDAQARFDINSSPVAQDTSAPRAVFLHIAWRRALRWLARCLAPRRAAA